MAISHKANAPHFEAALRTTKDRLIALGDSHLGPLAEKLVILDQLTEFELGRFLIAHGGMNGRWSHYSFYEFPRLFEQGHSFHPLEIKILSLQGMRSASERMKLAQNALMPNIRDGMEILSVPCGVMAELSTLNLRELKGIRLVGIDIERDSLVLAKEFAEKMKPIATLELREGDAWNLGFEKRFDAIFCLGLNM